MGHVHCPTASPAPVRLRTLRAKLQNAQEAIATCEGALTRFPGDPVYSRSLAHWQRVEANVSARIAARVGG